MSLSPSTSNSDTERTPLRAFEITCSLKAGGELPSLSCHTIPSSNKAERMSVSPSPSTSVAKTETGPPAVVEITRSVNVGGEPPSLSYHAILSSSIDAERTSVSPSPSKSVAKTELAPFAVV